ncbi:MAG: tetratricopeptide repeat protein [Kangiellaceae bacterium]|nr:tetratricopeptide repeat protein [Kangiellaceae bacterium]
MKFICLVAILSLLSGCSSNANKGQSAAIKIETRAQHYYKSANLQLAETEYLALIKLVPLYAEGWFKLGNIYLRTNQLEAAIRHYKKALSYDSKMSKGWHNLALARIRQATDTLVEGKQKVDEGNSAEIQILLAKLLRLQRVE